MARHPYFAGHGYASIRVDIRGSGHSDGILADEYVKREQDDALEIIDWLGEQEWCTDAVGVFGKLRGAFLFTMLLHGFYNGVFCPFGEPGNLASDQRIENGYAVVYTSDPLEENKELLGHPIFHAEVSADQSNAMMAVRLCAKAPTGESSLISLGMLNLTHFQSHEQPELLSTGEKYLVSIKLEVIGQQIP